MGAEPAAAGVPAPRVKPRLRGVTHEAAFYVALVLAPLLVAHGAHTTLGGVSAAVFAGAVAAMFGVSALYHRVTWTQRARRLLCRLDHATIYLLIAGTYTPCGLLALDDAWRAAVLSVVWGGCALAALLKIVWVDQPKWLASPIAVAIGSVGFAALPQLAHLGAAALTLLVVGGALYVLGAIVYALRRPDPLPHVFGYHEVFHALVVAAVACDYVAIAFWVLGA